MGERPQQPTMIGLTLPDVDVWSERVAVALGQNPSLFAGPGTNTCLVGTGKVRILLDTGQGVHEYIPVLERAMARVGCEAIQEIVITHGHVDHIGGALQVIERFGPLRVSKLPHEGMDGHYSLEVHPLEDQSVVETEGATLRAIHTPGHAEDHLCFVLEEEGALFSGDNVLGVGTTVIPAHGGDLLDYMNSLERLLREKPRRIYPAHGPVIEDGRAKIREYIDHRRDRELQILEALRALGPSAVPEIVERVYTDVPEVLHGAAALSVTSHLIKLEREGRAARHDSDGDPQHVRWKLR
jgi:glyoxylase-like metal-dependent hydrolase (beta-lactamase superfamily II)